MAVGPMEDNSPEWLQAAILETFTFANTEAFGINWLENGQMKVKFRKPAYPGDRVRTGGEVVRAIKCGRLKTIYCQLILVGIDDGQEIISGTAEVTIPIE